MRILYHHRTAAQDGQSVHIESMIAAWRRAGHDVDVIGPRVRAASFGGASKLAGVKTLIPRFLYELLELAYGGHASLKLLRAAKRFKPDFIYERANLFLPAGAFVARRIGCPFFLEINAPLADERAANGDLSLKALARSIEHALWRRADRAFPVSGVLKSMVEAEGAQAEKVIALHNGVDLEDYPDHNQPAPNQSPPHQSPPTTSEDDASDSPSSKDQPTRIGFIGFVRDWHRLDLVIDALSARKMIETKTKGSSTATFQIVGDGPALEAIREHADHKGVSQSLDCLGVRPRAEIPSLARGFDIAVQPDVTDYASPLKLFDYMAAGCAIIAPNKPNIREVLRHEDNALLVDPGDPKAFRQALDRLLSDADLRARLGQAARQSLLDAPYSWDANAERVIEEAKKVLSTEA